ncbi:kinase-like domain-containing protein [Pisolithus croceorrhizus]|nr:kinase-like domain-containing protein [Pisolithus croceorrhizus]
MWSRLMTFNNFLGDARYLQAAAYHGQSAPVIDQAVIIWDLNLFETSLYTPYVGKASYDTLAACMHAMRTCKRSRTYCTLPLCRRHLAPNSLAHRPSSMDQQHPLSDTSYQQKAVEISSVLHRLADRASEFSINLNGDIRHTSGKHPLRGGTAIVHHGTWIPHGTEVAIKTFLNALSETEAEIKRLFREVHTWSKLRHENIVPMLGISTEFDSTISIISEWMPLGNAHDYVKNTEHDPRPLLEGIASGLYYLHSHELGVVHGDLEGVSMLGFQYL